jgi:hypothetical protein
MKKLFSMVAALAASLAFADAAFDYDEACSEFDRFYVGAVATGTLPQGGSKISPRAGAAVRAGCYLAEMWAIEGEAGFADDHLAFAAKALWHWWGYERLDPFFTFGARGWTHDGNVGPSGGLGAFYHMTESLSLRFDADATLGLDTDVEMIYSLAFGLQLSF